MPIPPPIVAPMVYLDGVDAGAYGLVVDDWQGDLTPAVAAPPTAPRVGRLGEILTGAPATVAPRTLRLTGTLYATSPAALTAAKDALVRACLGVPSGASPGPVVVAIVASGESVGRQWTAYFDRATELQRADRAALAETARVTLVFTVPDPAAYATAATVLTLGTSVARGAVGTAGSRPLIALAGPFTVRTITRQDGSGAARGTCTITGAVASGETVEVDSESQSVVHVQGTTRTPRNTWLTGGTFLTLDPELVLGGVTPGLVLDGGTGTATYHVAWR